MQFVPPAPDSVSVTDPAGHTAHATVETALYCPAMHAVHVVAPLPANVSVVDPAPHGWHRVDPLPLYRPAPHTTHAVDALLS